MENTLRLKPAPNVVVIDPLTGVPLPSEGANVQDSTYWRRRLRDGSVAHIQPIPERPEPAVKRKPQSDGA